MLAFLLVLTGCGDGSDKEGSSKTELIIHSESEENLPQEVKAKLKALTESKTEGEATVRKGDRIYLLVALGERPTGGYGVELTKAELIDEKLLEVYAKEVTPSKDSITAQALTYPVGVGYIETDSAEDIKEYQFHVEKAPKREVPSKKPKEKAPSKTELRIHSVAKNDLPSEVKVKADELSNTKKEGHGTVRSGNRIYLIVALGERTTGGYSVEFTKGELVNSTKLQVYAKEIAPSKGSIVVQGFSYPVGVGYIEIDSPASIKEYQFHVEKVNR